MNMKSVFYLIAVQLCLVQLLTAMPRPEYPRPQFARADWVNLNGEWSYTFDFGGSGLERDFCKSNGFDSKITVPFCPESKLSGVGYTDFIPHMWYQRMISVPEAWGGKEVWLHFGAVYYRAEVYLDGQFVGRHFGGTSSFAFNIAPFVKPGGQHSLVVYVQNDVRSGKQPAGKQNLQYASYGCNYTRTTGIWQTVWMEPADRRGIHSVQVTTDIDQEQIVVNPRFFGEEGGTFLVIVKAGDRVVARKETPVGPQSVVVLPVRKMRLWSPEDPYLYDLVYQVKDASGKVVDEVTGYAGMRKIHIEKKKIFLNNKPYYQRLVLDQGFYPDGIWTAPSDAALRGDIELSLAAGFNGARLHQKVFEERFHYWADRLGYLTWGEASSWGMDCNDPQTARNFITEWSEIVSRDRNHPSILIWTPTNEEFWPDRVQYPRLIDDLCLLTKLIDPTRPFHGASGGTHIATDIWTVHNYEQNPDKLKQQLYNDGKLFAPPKWEVHLPVRNIGFNDVRYTDRFRFPQYDGRMPYLLDEFGGIKWNPAQQSQSAQNTSWGYGDAPRSIDEFYDRLEKQVEAVLSLSDHIWGYCYTQLTDVEQEQNGIYYYDRSPKFDMKRIQAVFSREPGPTGATTGKELK